MNKLESIYMSKDEFVSKALRGPYRDEIRRKYPDKELYFTTELLPESTPEERRCVLNVFEVVREVWEVQGLYNGERRNNE